MTPEQTTRDQVVRAVGAVIARRAPTNAPVPVLAEGTAPVVMRAVPVARRWPWIAAGVIALGAGALALTVGLPHRTTDTHYPIVTTADEEASLAQHAERWRRGRTKLLAALAQFAAPPLATLSGAGACALTFAPVGTAADDAHAASDDPDALVAATLVVLPGEELRDLDVLARPDLDTLIAAGDRGRFRTPAAKTRVLAAIAGAYVVVTLDEQRAGFAHGTAYAFDPETGALRCAGELTATGDDLPLAAERAIAGSLRAID